MATEYVLHIKIDNFQSTMSKAQEKLDDATGKSSGSSNKKNEKLKKSVKALAARTAMQTVNDIAKPIVEYGISSYSARYGNSARMNVVKNIQTVASDLGSIAGGALAGASVGGGWGAVIGGVLSAAAVAVNKVENAITYNTTQEKYKFEEIRNSERIGLMLSDRNRNR